MKPRPSLRFTKDFGFFDQRSNAHQWREWKVGDVADLKDVEWLLAIGAPVVELIEQPEAGNLK